MGRGRDPEPTAWRQSYVSAGGDLASSMKD
jgi:hypothetical protein